MKKLIDRILQDGYCLEGGVLKVDRFVNHQMDPGLMKQVAVEFFFGLAVLSRITSSTNTVPVPPRMVR